MKIEYDFKQESEMQWCPSIRTDFQNFFVKKSGQINQKNFFVRMSV